jgi:WD40 repeat protein
MLPFRAYVFPQIWRRIFWAVVPSFLAVAICAYILKLGTLAAPCRTLIGSEGFLPIEFSKDGGMILGADFSPEDESFAVTWDVRTGHQVNRISRERGLVAVALFPDDRLALIRWRENRFIIPEDSVGIEGGRVVLHNLAQDTVSLMIDKARYQYPFLAFSHDSKKLAAVGHLPGEHHNTCLKIWDLDTHESMILFVGATHSDGLSDFRFSPDGKLLGAAFSDGRIEFWNVADGKCQFAIKIEDGRIPLDCKLSPDLRIAVTRTTPATADDGTALREPKLWSLSLESKTANLEGSLGMGTQSVFFTTGETFITTPLDSQDLFTRLSGMFSFGRGPRVPLVHDLSNGGYPVIRIPPWCRQVLLSPDGQTVAVAPLNGGPIELWDLPARKPCAPILALAGVGILAGAAGWWLSKPSKITLPPTP